MKACEESLGPDKCCVNMDCYFIGDDVDDCTRCNNTFRAGWRNALEWVLNVGESSHWVNDISTSIQEELYGNGTRNTIST